MNIMLVSVTERIREIGLRKALGATPRLIRRQFLLEASVLGLTGGALGALLGLLGAVLLPHAIGVPDPFSAGGQPSARSSWPSPSASSSASTRPPGRPGSPPSTLSQRMTNRPRTRRRPPSRATVSDPPLLAVAAADLVIALRRGRGRRGDDDAPGPVRAGASGTWRPSQGRRWRSRAATGQVTVSWTSSTTFTQNGYAAASSVAVGDCVTVTGTTAKSTTITAKTVTIVPAPSSGICTNGAGFAAVGARGGREQGGTGQTGRGRAVGVAGERQWQRGRRFPGGEGGPPNGASGNGPPGGGFAGAAASPPAR